MLTAALLNDTRRERLHIGCNLTVKNIILAAKEANIHIRYTDKYHKERPTRKFIKNIKDCDLILLNGEGTLHDSAGKLLFEKCLEAKRFGKKIYLINTVWQNNQYLEKYLPKLDAIYVRESLSKQEISKNYQGHVKIVPDMVFYNVNNDKRSNNINKSDTVAFDSVIEEVSSAVSQYCNVYKIPMYFMGTAHFKKFSIRNKKMILNLFSNCKQMSPFITNPYKINEFMYVVTGRYHGACLSILNEIPFISIESNTHKIKGMLLDANLDIETHHINNKTITPSTIDECINNLKKNIDINTFKAACKNYKNIAQSKIKMMFSEISNHGNT